MGEAYGTNFFLKVSLVDALLLKSKRSLEVIIESCPAPDDSTGDGMRWECHAPTNDREPRCRKLAGPALVEAQSTVR
jgi:hypothetical protein